MKWAPSPLCRTIIAFVAITLVCLIFSDIAVATVEPWPEFRRLLAGLITPNFFGTEKLTQAILYTLSFALLGVVLANLFGLLLAVFFSSRIVRVGCAIVRSVHELFWALIFLQIFGLSPLTGILAIAIPYTGIIAKVYSSILLKRKFQLRMRILEF